MAHKSSATSTDLSADSSASVHVGPSDISSSVSMNRLSSSISSIPSAAEADEITAAVEDELIADVDTEANIDEEKSERIARRPRVRRARDWIDMLTRSGQSDLETWQQMTRADKITAIESIERALDGLNENDRFDDVECEKYETKLLELPDESNDDALHRLKTGVLLRKKRYPELLALLSSLINRTDIECVKLGLNMLAAAYGSALALVAKNADQTLNEGLNHCKNSALALLLSKNDGIRSSCLALVEMLILTQTNATPNQTATFNLASLPHDHTLLNAYDVTKEAEKLLDQLIKYTVEPEHMSIANLSVVLSSLASIARQRSKLCERLIIHFLSIARTLPQKFGASHKHRVMYIVKSCLMSFLRNQTSPQHSDGIVELLKELGYQDDVVIALRQAEMLQHQKQTQAELSTVMGEAPAAPSSAASDFHRALEDHTFRSILNGLTALPPSLVAELVIKSFDHLNVQTKGSAALSGLFLTFLANVKSTVGSNAVSANSCSLSTSNTVASAIASAPRISSSMTVTESIEKQSADTSISPVKVSLPANGTHRLTTVPDIKVPTLTEAQFESLSRSAFARILSTAAQNYAETSGRAALRLVIITKLVTSPIDTVVHTVVVNETISPLQDSSDFMPATDAIMSVSSNVGDRACYTSLLSHILADFSACFELSLRWLYALLSVFPQEVIFHCRSSKALPEELRTFEEVGEGEDKEITADVVASDEDENADVGEYGDVEGGQDVFSSEKFMASSATFPSSLRKLSRKRSLPSLNRTHESKRLKVLDNTEASCSDKNVMTDIHEDSNTKTIETIVVKSGSECSWPWLTQGFGTPEYISALHDLLAGVESTLLAGTTAIAQQTLFIRFLLDLPILTDAVFDTLERCINEDSKMQLGLNALVNLTLHRPSNRDDTLGLLLDTCHSHERSDTRNAAIRAVRDRMYPLDQLRSSIVDFAIAKLRLVAQPSFLSDMPEVIVNIDVPPSVEEQLEKIEKIKSTETVSTISSDNEPQPDTSILSDEDRRMYLEKKRVDQAEAVRLAIEHRLKDAAEKQKLREKLTVMRQVALRERELAERNRDEVARQREDRVLRHIDLFVVLIHKNPSLITILFETFAMSDLFVRRCIKQQLLLNLPQLVQSGGLLPVFARISEAYLEKNSKYHGSEELLRLTIARCVKDAKPAPQFVKLAIDIHAKLHDDVATLLPVLLGFSYEQLRKFIPLIIKSPAETLKHFLTKLYGQTPGPNFVQPPMSAVDFLVAIHLLVEQTEVDATETANTSSDLQKAVMHAIGICIANHIIYTDENLSSLITRLVDVNPLPKLLLRTMIQVRILHPSLSPFLVHMLSQLVMRRIWNVPALWEGWIRLAMMLAPASFVVICSLPKVQFAQLLNDPIGLKMRETLKQTLSNPASAFPVRRDVHEALFGFPPGARPVQNLGAAPGSSNLPGTVRLASRQVSLPPFGNC